MKKHCSITIPSYTIFILLSCFILPSEGRTRLPLDKIFGEPSCNEWYIDYQQSLVHPFYYNFQNKEAGNYTPFCSGSVHFFFYTETSYILEKRCVFSKWNRYIGTTQRSPPFSFDQLYI